MPLIPLLQTIKTKLCSTQTLHMITSNILFHKLFTQRTSPSIFFDPLFTRFCLIDYFLPFLYLCTQRRLMRLLLTLKTISSPTNTLYVSLLNHYWFLTKICAVLWWTVTYRFIDYSIIFTYFISIKLYQIRCYFFNKMNQYRSLIASITHTIKKYLIIYQILSNIPNPAIFTKIMLTKIRLN